MSIDSEAGDSGRRSSARGSSVFTAVLVATLLVVASLVSQVSAHDTGTTSHLWDHFKGLKVAGTINADTNPVHWTKLKGVPAGLADGVDHGVTVAGFGLNKVWSAFWVDPTEVQKRVTTACPSGQAIKSIRQDGTAVCAAVSQALHVSKPAAGYICNNYCTEASIALPAGTWAITAKLTGYQAEGLEDEIQVSCRLHALDVTDQADQWNRDGRAVTLFMQLVVTVGSGEGVYLDCRDHDTGQVLAEDMSIIAIRVGG